MFAFTFFFRSSRSSRGAFHFFCTNKRNETKKIRGSRSEAKIFTFFLKKKNSLTLKQLFLLHGKQQKFLHASPLNAGTHRRTQMRFAVTATSEAMFKIHPLLKIPASFFCREAEVLFGALKTKSCLSEASSFCLA